MMSIRLFCSGIGLGLTLLGPGTGHACSVQEAFVVPSAQVEVATVLPVSPAVTLAVPTVAIPTVAVAAVPTVSVAVGTLKTATVAHVVRQRTIVRQRPAALRSVFRTNRARVNVCVGGSCR